MNSSLSRLEARLQRFIEDGTALLFPSKDMKSAFAARLAERMQAEVQFNGDGNLVAPHMYTIEVNNEDSAALQSNQRLITALQSALKNAASQAEIILQDQPILQFKASSKIPVGDFEVRSLAHEDKLSSTQSLEIPENSQSALPFAAFLIVNGANIFPLSKSIINIGRKGDNDLVLDDSQVSRRHAQLRAVSGSYHFFDLGSTGGSTINGQKVKSAALLAGDVISLAGVPLIYGHDNSSAEAETQEIDASKKLGSEKPTTDIKPAG